MMMKFSSARLKFGRFDVCRLDSEVDDDCTVAQLVAPLQFSQVALACVARGVCGAISVTMNGSSMSEPEFGKLWAALRHSEQAKRLLVGSLLCF
jgi:hypothetical protein